MVSVLVVVGHHVHGCERDVVVGVMWWWGLCGGGRDVMVGMMWWWA